ncbi:MAG: ABC transporter ATP-binding protein, partial [Corynebacterium sp.]|nr:ABC transporter ATP-binding protein [Corynebacterium sp.]
DLAFDTLQELESLLDGWAGTMVVISHDRYLVERICDSTWALFGDGRLTNLPGGISQYLDRRAEQAALENRHTGNMALGGASDKTAEPAAPTAPALSAQEDRALSKELGALERKMSKVQANVDDLNRRMAEASAPADGNIDTALLSELDTKLSAARDEHEELEMSWLEVAERRETGC